MGQQLREDMIHDYGFHLQQEEKSRATIEKYMRDIRRFYNFLPEDKRVDKAQMLRYKQYLIETYKAASANSMLAAVNGFLSNCGCREYCLKSIRVQQQIFCRADRELTKKEYYRLLQAAKKGKSDRLYALMQTICSTGIRVGELRFVTVEAVKQKKVCIYNKGKERIVLLVSSLRNILNQYIERHRIKTGPVFITRTGKPVNRSNIWAEMKKLCEKAGVSRAKVFPHNLRHLFAVTLYGINKDLVRLADLLGHSSINTTRIYTKSSGLEHMRLLERLELCDWEDGKKTERRQRI